jgi:hypothetical protein
MEEELGHANAIAAPNQDAKSARAEERGAAAMARSVVVPEVGPIEPAQLAESVEHIDKDDSPIRCAAVAESDRAA